MPNVTCRKCGRGAYESSYNNVICVGCEKDEDNCECIKKKYSKKEILTQVKRHLKGIEKAITKLEE